MRVNEKFPEWLTSGGITSESFTGLVSNLVFPYFYAQDKPVFRYPYEASVFPTVTIGTQAQWLSSLDVMFATRFGQRHLLKWVSDLDVHTDSTKTVTVDNIRYTNIIAQMINERYGDKWNKIAEALAIDYDPLVNYDRDEKNQFQHSNSGTDSDVTTFTGRKTDKEISGGYTDADTRGVTKGGKVKTDRQTDDSALGFNSGTAVDTDKQHVVETVEYAPTQADAYKETNSGSIQRTYNTYKETETPSGTETITHNINNGSYGWDNSQIKGNIGVTTSQQMLTQELEVRKNVLFDIILNDIAEMLTISIY